MLEKRKLGKSDIEITPLGLGTWQFSEEVGFQRFFWPTVKADIRTQIVKEAVENGINWFDSAELYGFGASERGLRDSLLELNHTYPDVLVATKWNPMFRTVRSLVKTIDKRLECLSPFPISLHQIHAPWPLRRRKAEMKAFAKLLDAKQVESVGVSNYNVKQTRTSFNTLEELGYPLVSNQVKYSIFDRRCENELVPYAKEVGMTVIAYSPLEQGVATGRFHDDPNAAANFKRLRRTTLNRTLNKHKEEGQRLIDEMKSIAGNHEATVAQVALNWLINFHGDTVVAIPGASKPHHAKSNAGAMNFSLSREELNILDELSQVYL